MTNHVLKHHNKALLTLLQKIDELRELNQLFARYIGIEMGKHCEMIKFEKNCLFVMVDSGTWTTQLRFQIPDLIAKLRTHPKLAQLNGIICKTRPHHSLTKPSALRARRMQHLSPVTAEKILSIAEKMKDKKLKRILEKIASNH